MRRPIVFGKYLLLERVNVGGMAEVFVAKAFGVEGFERIVAIKRILPTMAEDAEFIQMFIDEARISVLLNHPNIVHIHELGKHDHSYFIAMEYVSGRDLRAILEFYRRRNELMPVSQAAYITAKICEGLDYAHRKRDARGQELFIIHRDVSPQNIIVGYEGDVKIIDFGIAKAANRSQKTQAGILKGKFGYMSPEQVRGLPIDRRSDIFALGVIFYELLTGEKLFVGESDFSTLEKVRHADVPSPATYNASIPPSLERIVLKALAREADDRYAWASEMQEDLQLFLRTEGKAYARKELSDFATQSFANEWSKEQERLRKFEAAVKPAEPRKIPVPKTTPISDSPELGEFGDEKTSLMQAATATGKRDDIVEENTDPQAHALDDDNVPPTTAAKPANKARVVIGESWVDPGQTVVRNEAPGAIADDDEPRPTPVIPEAAAKVPLALPQGAPVQGLTDDDSRYARTPISHQRASKRVSFWPKVLEQAMRSRDWTWSWLLGRSRSWWVVFAAMVGLAMFAIALRALSRPKSEVVFVPLQYSGQFVIRDETTMAQYPGNAPVFLSRSGDQRWLMVPDKPGCASVTVLVKPVPGELVTYPFKFQCADPSETRVSTYTAFFISDEPGVEVFSKDKLLGRTPFRIPDWEQGRDYTIFIKRGDIQATRTFRYAGDAGEYEVRLGALTLSPEVAVGVEGVPDAGTFTTDSVADGGTREVAVATAQPKQVKRVVVPVENKKSEKKESFVPRVPVRGKTGFVIANSSPTGAEVWVDGRNSGKRTPMTQTTRLELPVGKHRVTFKYAGRRDALVEVLVSEDGTVRLPAVTLEPRE